MVGSSESLYHDLLIFVLTRKAVKSAAGSSDGRLLLM